METKEKTMGTLLETSNPEALERKIAELSAEYGVSLPIVGALAADCENEAELEDRVKEWEASEFYELPEVQKFLEMINS